jgi:hypothetical protein
MQTTIRRIEDFAVRPTLQGDGRNRNNLTNTGSFTTISRDVSFRETNRSIQDFIGERITDIEIIPFMRSRKINFTAKGLRPNTKMFAFFGNKDVSSWVREETTSSRFSDNPTEFSSEYANALEYPSDLGGPTDLITDSKGELIGSFFLPNTPAISFRTGKQEFKLLDVSVNDEDEATVSTRAIYTSTGSIETVQRTIQTTRIINPPRAARQDPLAQTFFVDQIENPNGMFITKARIFVSSKDSSVPLQIQIRPVENGIPTTRIVPGAVKFLDPSQITIATNSVSNPNDGTSPAETIEDVQAYPTEVEFDEPIFLTSGEEYAIVLLAESVEYNVYVAQTYEFVFGSDEDKVSRQPSLGSLFLSQNGFTWTPDQTKDLMFELDRAEFSASGDLILDNAPLPKVTLGSDPIETTQGSSLVKVYHEGHGFISGDIVRLSGVVNPIGGLSETLFNTTLSVVNPQWDGYSIDIDTDNSVSATSSSVGGGLSVVATQQVYYDEFVPQVQSLTPNKTRITSTLVNPTVSSFGGTRSTAQFNYNSSNTNIVFLNDYNKNLSPSVVASSENASGVETMKFTLSLTTEDSKVSPVIDLQRVSVLALENVIDNGDAAQHITTPVVIDEASLGLKVIFAANRPSGANFEVYVRSSADEDSLVATDEVTGAPVIDWVLVDIDKALPTDDDPSTFRDYEFTHESDQFTVFQVKIVMQSNSSSKSPVIRDLRAIAMVV